MAREDHRARQPYFYCVDRDFGPFFIKFCSYFPYNAKVCFNGHEFLERQLARRDIAFEPLDNGLLSCADPKRAEHIAESLDPDKIDRFIRKWLRILPYPFPRQDRAAGFLYSVRRDRVTPLGVRSAMFLTRAYDGLLRPGLSLLSERAEPPRPAPLRDVVLHIDKAIQMLWADTG